MMLATNGLYSQPNRLVHLTDAIQDNIRFRNEESMLHFPLQQRFETNTASCKLGRVLPDNWVH